jgi:anti-sigma regulatory factor (Ser/Thr protein kinase)
MNRVPDATARSMRLPCDPGAARTARDFVRDALRAWGVDDVDRVVELLTDELVGNVVRHVGSPMEVRVSCGDHVLRIEVDDRSTKLPVRHHPDRFDEHGRGIVFVETLATDWGVDLRDDGKTIWFELSTSPARELPTPG